MAGRGFEYDPFRGRSISSSNLENLEESLKRNLLEENLNRFRAPLSLPSFVVNRNFNTRKLDRVSISTRHPNQDFYDMTQDLIDKATYIGKKWITFTTSKNPIDIEVSSLMQPLSEKINFLLSEMRANPDKVKRKNNEYVELLKHYVKNAELIELTYDTQIKLKHGKFGGKRNTRRRRQTRRVRKHK